jgi:Bax protein
MMFARDRWKQVVCVTAIMVLVVVVGSRHGCEDLPDFAAIADADERKIAFITHLLPMVEEANQEIEQMRTRLLAIDAGIEAGWAVSSMDRNFVRTLAKRHGLEEVSEINRALLAQILRRVDTVPASLVIAQAAIESGWGTSRFAREGNNLFGLRSYAAGGGLVPRQRTPGARFTVAAYPSACDGVRAYIHNLNSDPRYRDLRGIRATLRTSGLPASGDRLAYGLLNYSERGADYVEQVRSLIAYNELGRFDS